MYGTRIFHSFDFPRPPGVDIVEELCSSVEKISRQNGLPFLPNFEDFEDADLTVFSFFKDFTRRLYG